MRLLILQNGRPAIWLGHFPEQMRSNLKTKVYAFCMFSQNELKKKKKHPIEKKACKNPGH